jgi:hypothetical protein
VVLLASSGYGLICILPRFLQLGCPNMTSRLCGYMYITTIACIPGTIINQTGTCTCTRAATMAIYRYPYIFILTSGRSAIVGLNMRDALLGQVVGAGGKVVASRATLAALAAALCLVVRPVAVLDDSNCLLLGEKALSAGATAYNAFRFRMTSSSFTRTARSSSASLSWT